MRVMVVVAHPDDEVLGVGGTIAKLSSEGHFVYVLICCKKRLGDDLSDELNRSYRQMASKAIDILGVAGAEFLDFPDERLPAYRWDLLKDIERYASQWQPNEVYTHCMEDYNQDHREVCRACQIAFRPWGDVQALYHMEVPSSTRPDFTPNRFVALSEEAVRAKLRAWAVYEAEHRDDPHPRSDAAIRALMTWRGSQAGLTHAEAFEVGFQKA